MYRRAWVDPVLATCANSWCILLLLPLCVDSNRPSTLNASLTLFADGFKLNAYQAVASLEDWVIILPTWGQLEADSTRVESRLVKGSGAPKKGPKEAEAHTIHRPIYHVIDVKHPNLGHGGVGYCTSGSRGYWSRRGLSQSSAVDLLQGS